MINMVRGAALAVSLTLALAWACGARASVLVPTYVLPPDSFVRDQRSLGAPDALPSQTQQRTIRRLIGGHMKIKSQKEYGDPSKNSFAFNDKSESGKYVPDESGGTVGWNQGVWDDGMLMSSAGEGKEVGKGVKDDDEDRKTLSDQVAEGKYGLIQNEIFVKDPKRPGILSYDVNSETRNKDNVHNLGGLKKEEIWLAEDHLLVLKGGSFPESYKDNDRRPPIDDYVAPRRQVKLPQKPIAPPPFPVRLSDDGPLVFLTPNGSVPAPLFPPFPEGESDGPFPFAPYPFAPGAPGPDGQDQGNSTAGGAPYPIPPFPFLSGNVSEGAPYPFPPSMNGSFADGFPPGAAFLPPPSNQSDLYDEDDPSIYYPPPYNFSYHTEKTSNVPAGPIVPGILLPPPPDFFAPLEEKSTTEDSTTTYRTTTTTTRIPNKIKPALKRPPQVTTPYRKPFKSRPTTETTHVTDEPSTVTSPPPVVIVTTPKLRHPPKTVQIPHRNSLRAQIPVEVQVRPKPEKHTTRQKLTSKPLSVSVIYDYPQQAYNNKITTTEKPYVYNIQGDSPNLITENIVTSTPVPLRAYYTNTESEKVPTTKLQPVYNRQPNENALASFYFYDEQPKTTAAPVTYFDGRNYYKAVPIAQTQLNQQNVNNQAGFSPSVDVAYGSIDQSDSLFYWPQKQGPKTLTQEYFSIQKPVSQQLYLPPKVNSEPFYQQISDIQQTIDFYTTKRPKQHSHRSHKPKAITTRPVYQFSYQSNLRPDQLSFRAPKMDPEPFRPMVSYSKPFNVDNDFNAITPSISSPRYNQQYLVENIKVSTETPTPSRYYPKTQSRDEDYVDTPVKDHRTRYHPKNQNHIPIQEDKPGPYVHINHRKQPSTTPNPISHGYYTKQDERYFDDITKNSFDIFGKKIEDNSHDVHGIGVTPPIGTAQAPIDNRLKYAYEIVDTQNQNVPNLEGDTQVNHRHPIPSVDPNSEQLIPQVHKNSELVLQQKPPSLLGDTLVNERLPRPTVNPDSEFIPIPNPAYRNSAYKVQTQVQRPQFTGEQYDLNQHSLADDIAVNYKRPLPALNPDAEWISPVNSAGEGRPGSFVSYRLPGENAHVYFLTPQAAQNRDRYNAYRTYGR